MLDRNLLFVEGKDEAHVFYHFLQHHQIPKQFKIENKEGIDNLLETLPPTLRANSELERIGIVIDADTDLNSRWTALSNILKNAGNVPNLPINPDPNGTIVTLEKLDSTLTVGIWIMPDNTVSGMLENFVSFLIPQDDTLWGKADNSLRQISAEERRFPLDHRVKAQLYTWLAWQKEPGKPLGTAIAARYLDADAPHAQQLIAWIKRLFDL